MVKAMGLSLSNHTIAVKCHDLPSWARTVLNVGRDFNDEATCKKIRQGISPASPIRDLKNSEPARA